MAQAGRQDWRTDCGRADRRTARRGARAEGQVCAQAGGWGPRRARQRGAVCARAPTHTRGALGERSHSTELTLGGTLRRNSSPGFIRLPPAYLGRVAAPADGGTGPGPPSRGPQARQGGRRAVRGLAEAGVPRGEGEGVERAVARGGRGPGLRGGVLGQRKRVSHPEDEDEDGGGGTGSGLDGEMPSGGSAKGSWRGRGGFGKHWREGFRGRPHRTMVPSTELGDSCRGGQRGAAHRAPRFQRGGGGAVAISTTVIRSRAVHLPY